MLGSDKKSCMRSLTKVLVVEREAEKEAEGEAEGEGEAGEGDDDHRSKDKEESIEYVSAWNKVRISVVQKEDGLNGGELYCLLCHHL